MHDFLQKYLSTQRLAEMENSKGPALGEEVNPGLAARSNPRVTAALEKIPNSVFQWRKFGAGTQRSA